EKSLNSKVAEFSPQLTLAINGLQDADAVVADAFNWQPAAPFTLRYGRLQLENAYGPETQSLTLPARAEYWNGSRFAVNTDDSCWGYSAALASPETSGLTTVTGNNGVLLQGQADMVALSAPGAGNTGTVRINYARSEERRVGKGCGSSCVSPAYHLLEGFPFIQEPLSGDLQ